MERSWLLSRWLLLSLMMATSTGCQLLFAGVYLIKGNDIPAECTDLDEQRVVVVCRRPPSLEYRDGSVDRDLARAVGDLLSTNVKNIDVVDYREVEAWTDEQDLDDVDQIAKAMHADRVVEIDLEEFGLRKGQTLLQGRAYSTIYVYDTSEGKSKEIWNKPLGQSLFPKAGGVHVQDKPEPEFRGDFIEMLSEEIARHFYSHDGSRQFANDGAAHY